MVAEDREAVVARPETGSYVHHIPVSKQKVGRKVEVRQNTSRPVHSDSLPTAWLHALNVPQVP